MTRLDYEAITEFIFGNARVIQDENGNEDASFEIEFHYEAKQRGFSDQEIEAALRTYL